MCRLTDWRCDDLSSKDLPRLRDQKRFLEKKLAHGIKISQNGRILPLRLEKINSLPFGFELLMKFYGPEKIDSIVIHYTLLSDKKPDYLSFFQIKSHKRIYDKKVAAILDKNHSEIIWNSSGRERVLKKSMTRELIFNLKSYVERDLPWYWVIFGFFAAFVLGIGHAFTPGHGKSIMAAFLVGHHGHIKDAFVMGLTTTFAHTFSVIALGIIFMFFSSIILPSTLYPALAKGSAILIIIVGIYVLYRRIMEFKNKRKGADKGHHEHHHTHHHHYYSKDDSISQAFWIALSSGLLPCPSALGVLLAAISIGKIGYGILMILFFSFGLGATLVLIGIGILTSRSFIARMEGMEKYLSHLSLIGPIFIILMGILLLFYGPFGSVTT